MKLDARWIQILWLCSLLTVGVLWRDFSLHWQQVALTFTGAMMAQYLGMCYLRAKLLRIGQLQKWQWSSSDFLSGFVTAFGISLLVRSDNYWVHPLLAVVAISSKFVVTVARPDNRAMRTHLFNPANLAAMLAAFVVPGAWLSPGQWGQDPVLALLFCAMGLGVTILARRWDIALVFIGTFALYHWLRIEWLEANPAILQHQLSNGALLLFTFFMITDPLTTPQNRSARLGFAVLVATAAFVWQTTQFKPNGPIIALFFMSLIVPLINRLTLSRSKGHYQHYYWRGASTDSNPASTWQALRPKEAAA
jgi:enediyne biosynthesis protein E5